MSKRKPLDLPKHKNPVDEQGRLISSRTACAPYNFVPLPEKVIPAVEEAEELPNHDTFANEAYPHTGYFKVKLTTKSPTYVRCAMTREQFDNQESDKYADGEPLPKNGNPEFRRLVKNLPDFFYTRENKKPVIPGSSLRGMLRNLIEIVSYSKVQWVTTRRLFFRTVDPSAVGRYYGERMRDVKGGFWCQQPDGSFKIEKCTVARILMHPYFRASCLKDGVGLAIKLRKAHEPLSQFIAEKLDFKTKRLLAKYTGSSPIPEELKKLLLKDLNRLLTRWIFQKDRFATLTLTEDIRQMIVEKPTGEKLIQLNRLLLEVAFPAEINIHQQSQSVVTALRQDNLFELYEGTGPKAKPKWSQANRDIQQGNVWIQKRQLESAKARHQANEGFSRFIEVFNISFTPSSEYDLEATLMLTGPMQNKKRAFLFIKGENPEFIEVPNDPSEQDVNKRLVERFHDDDQITQWQSSAFQKGKPNGASRKRDGYLRDKEPVFFLQENGKLTFFGRAQMFRLPYRKTPLDLVDSQMRRAEDIDFAEAILGYSKRKKNRVDDSGGVNANQGDKKRAYASRVHFTDAILTEASNGLWLSDKPITPKILATPKPTSFQQYLTQQESADQYRLDHYDSPPFHKSVIRGHKLYWHQDDRTARQLQPNPEYGELEPTPTSTQHTQFKPVKSGVTFSFRIYFENLSGEELGALCWALHPLGDGKKEYCHSLGMGKPLGMGAVKLDAVLHLNKREERYGSLFDGKGWMTGFSEDGQRLADCDELVKKFTDAFETRILEELKPFQKDGQAVVCSKLADLKRIGILLKMMEWPGFPANLPATRNNRSETPAGKPNTRYMTIELKDVQDVLSTQKNEYKDRPVLPDPSADIFGGLTGYAEPTSGDEPFVSESHASDSKSADEEGKSKAKLSPVASKQAVPKGTIKIESGKAESLTVPTALTVEDIASKHSKAQSENVQPSQEPHPATLKILEDLKKSEAKPQQEQTVKTVTSELVVFIAYINPKKARVQTENGEEIECSAMPGYPKLQASDSFRALVSRQNGKASSAVFAGWK